MPNLSLEDVKRVKGNIKKKIWPETRAQCSKLTRLLSRNIVGLAPVREDNGNGFKLDILLQREWPDASTKLCETVTEWELSNCSVQFVVAQFEFAEGLQSGSQISLGTGGYGKIGLFLQSGATRFALTCAHVLDGQKGENAFGGSQTIGRLHYKKKLSTRRPKRMHSPEPEAPNNVDCALVELGSDTIATNPVFGPVASCQPGDRIQVLGKSAEVKSVNADIRVIRVKGNNIKKYYFNDLILAEADVNIGDSGSHVTGQNNGPVGIVIATSKKQVVTIDASRQAYKGQLAIICDLQKILDVLKKEGKVSNLTLLGSAQNVG